MDGAHNPKVLARQKVKMSERNKRGKGRKTKSAGRGKTPSLVIADAPNPSSLTSNDFSRRKIESNHDRFDRVDEDLHHQNDEIDEVTIEKLKQHAALALEQDAEDDQNEDEEEGEEFEDEGEEAIVVTGNETVDELEEMFDQLI